ncbi:AAA family ATPase [Kineosporia sp. NBRC 101731]|uniref:AAA family ATPase n=1 Tax=Kineosporia sp. NBRC 101731 TaxID=3032199 RepID=UPI0024A43169|nr:AAA family ATPase [Kineosporia sp. NBRC 101731]GLY32489.1 hypothetical protein Kisp02_58540 [Kineosporia sp. NBRC 101731]
MSQETDPIDGLSLIRDSLAKGIVDDDKSKARDGIRRWVQRAGGISRTAAPWGLVASLAASALAPLAVAAAGGNLGAVFGEVAGLSGNFLPDALTLAAGRVEDETSEPEWRAAIAEAIAENLEHSQALQADVALLLESVGAVDATVAAASGASADVVASAREVLEAINRIGGFFEGFQDETVDTLQRFQDELAVRSAEHRQQNDRAHEQLVTMTGLLADVVSGLRTGSPETTVPPGAEVCPYPGLNSFEVQDADFFVGRAEAVHELVGRITQAAHTRRGPLVLVGVSGVGKSSLVRAGVVPALRRDEARRTGTGQWQVVVMTPTGRRSDVGAAAPADRRMVRPLVELAGRTGALAGVPVTGVLTDPCAFGALAAQAAGPTGHLLIVVDQFEQIFDAGTVGEQHRQEFVTALVNAAPAVVLISVRADFYDRCIRMDELAGYLPHDQVVLGPMSPEGLRQAVLHPAGRAGLVVEPALVELLLADLGVGGGGTYDPGSLPLLAHALKVTWNRREGRELTVDAYRAGGGISGAVAQEADELYGRLNPSEQNDLRRLLLRGVAVTGHEVTRRPVPRPEVMGRGLTWMIERRLMTADHESVQISHEALLWAWPRLAGWVAQERESLQLHQQLAASADYWAANTEDPGALLRGARLTAVQDWAAERDDLTPGERAFLDASLAAAQEELATERRRSRRLRRLAGALVVLLMVAVGAGGVAYRSARTAREQTAVAQSQRYAVQSAQMGVEDPRQAMLLAVRAWHEAQSPEALGALLSGQGFAHAGLLDTPAEQSTVTLSADGRWAAVGGISGKVQIWDTQKHTMVHEMSEFSSQIGQMGFSPNGRMLAAANKEGTRVWEVASGKPVRHLTGIFVVAWASDTSVVTTDMEQPGATLGVATWDVTNGRRIRQYLTSSPWAPSRIAISPDRSRLGVTRLDGSSVLLDLRTGRSIPLEPASKEPPKFPTQIVFSTRNELAVAHDEIGEISFWDGVTGKSHGRTGRSERSRNMVSAMTFSPEGNDLIVSSAGTLMIWSLRERHWIEYYVGAFDSSGEGAILSLSAPANGHLLAVAGIRATALLPWHNSVLSPSGDGIIALAVDQSSPGVTFGDNQGVLWRQDRRGVEPHQLFQTKESITSAAGSPDGSIAAGSVGGEVVVLDPDGKKRRTLSFGVDEDATDMTFSGDGARLAIAVQPADGMSKGSRIEIWDTRTFQRLARVDYPGQPFVSMTADAGGGRLAVVTRDNDEQTPAQLFLYQEADLLTSAPKPFRHIEMDPQGFRSAFSPDGVTVAVGSADGSIRVFDIRIGQLIRTFGRHPGEVRDLVFSPDGQTLATAASKDDVVHLWDVSKGTLKADLVGHIGEVNRVGFSPDGQTLFSTGTDGTVGVWNLDPQKAVDSICTALSGSFAEADWRAYGLDLAESPCAVQ